LVFVPLLHLDSGSYEVGVSTVGAVGSCSGWEASRLQRSGNYMYRACLGISKCSCDACDLTRADVDPNGGTCQRRLP
jgi:hypothetical protein